MSSTALMWAATVAPTADVQEYAILVRMADEADEAGCGVWLATSTIAEDVNVSEKTAQRRLDAMLARKLIGLGDQRLAAHIRADRRPVVYDLLIPAACFADLAKTNARRVAKGLAPLTPENRPIQAPPSDEHRRARRSDIGKPRPPRKLIDNPDGGREPDQQDHGDGGTTSHPVTGGLAVTPSATGGLPVPDGVTTSPARGDYKSPDPGIDPGVDPGTPPPVRTSVTTAPAEGETATGGSPLDEATRATLNDAAEAAAAVRAGAKGWKPAQVRAAIRDALDGGHPPALIAERIAQIAADTARTTFPTRLRPMLDTEAAEAARKAAQPAAAPTPPWVEGPFRHLDRDAPRCRQHPGNPAKGCGGCKADQVAADPGNIPVQRLDGEVARKTAAAAVAAARRNVKAKANAKARPVAAMDALAQVAAEVTAPATDPAPEPVGAAT